MVSIEYENLSIADLENYISQAGFFKSWGVSLYG